MPKQLILLAGLHKTATTSIQQTCAANQQALSKAGFSYPVIQGPAAGGGSNHTTIFKLFRRDPAAAGLDGQLKWTTADVGDAQPVLAAFAEQLTKVPAHLLMAAEGVSVFFPDELSGLKYWFEERGWEVRIICHVRHVHSWINSMIAQRVTSPIRFSIAQAVGEYHRHGSIVRRRIETIRQVFPQAEFYSHEEAVRFPSGPVGFFLQNAGIRLPGPIHMVRANEGSSDCATRVLSLINERFGRFDERKNLNRAFFGNQRFVSEVKGIDGPKFSLRTAEVAPILPLLDADNEWLKSELGEPFHDTQMVFDDARVEWTAEGLARLDRLLAATPGHVRDWVAANRSRLGIGA